jgi:hypothetical protein
VIPLGLLGVASVLLGLYMVTFGEVPSLGDKGPLIFLEGIDRLMCIYPIGLGLLFSYNAKCHYDDILDAVK